jgi:hypothetical protein
MGYLTEGDERYWEGVNKVFAEELESSEMKSLWVKDMSENSSHVNQLVVSACLIS